MGYYMALHVIIFRLSSTYSRCNNRGGITCVCDRSIVTTLFSSSSSSSRSSSCFLLFSHRFDFPLPVNAPLILIFFSQCHSLHLVIPAPINSCSLFILLFISYPVFSFQKKKRIVETG